MARLRSSRANVDGSGRRAAVDRHLQPGWVSAVDSMFNRVDSYTTENVTFFAGGRIEVRHFSWSRPMGSTWETGERCYLFNMSLSNSEPPALWTHLGTGLQVQRSIRGGLTFVPPGQRMSSSFGAGQSRSLCCMFDASVIEPFLIEAPDWSCNQARLRDCAHLGGTEVEWLLRRMYREVREPDLRLRAPWNASPGRLQLRSPGIPAAQRRGRSACGRSCTVAPATDP
jgi:hypothetical protein